MKKIVGLLLLLHSTVVLSQVTPNVNLQTGSLLVSVPLYTIQERDLQYPLTFNYTGNGVRLNNANGWAGLNWSFSAEAMISREVRGIADDYLGTGTDTRKGWLRGDMGSRIKSYSFGASEPADWAFLNTFANQDTEPDLFSVSLPNLSFQFYFDENQQYHIVPYQDIKLTKTTDPSTGQITSFTVVDSEGVTYLFQDFEHTTSGVSSSTIAPYYLNRKYSLNYGPYTYNYAWKISSITSPTSGQITFTYNEIFSPVNNVIRPVDIKARFNSPVTVRNLWHTATTMNYADQFTVKVLTGITTSSLQVEFQSNSGYQTDVQVTAVIISDIRSSKKLIRRFDLSYITVYYYVDSSQDYTKGWRFFLNTIKEGISSLQNPPYTFDYYTLSYSGGYGTTTLPYSDSQYQDAWGFYSQDVTAGMLKKVSFPLGGYSVFFYEPNQYHDNTVGADLTGGGVRLRKSITHDGVRSASDKIVEYAYQETNGQSSGHLFYKPGKTESVVYADALNLNGNMTNVYYRTASQMVSNNTITGPVDKYFSFSISDDIGHEDISGVRSAVVYDRVSVKQNTIGQSVYEFDFPAVCGDLTANNNEWQASVVNIARPGAPGSYVYEKGSIQLGAYQFPYPPNPNYNFARGLLKKVTDINEQGTIVRDLTYEYQRLYGGSQINKIYGLCFEDIFTYYYNTSYNNSRMFLYSKYEINTDVTTTVKKKTETFYDSGTPLQNVTSYFYESSNHRFPTRIVKTNSNQNQFVTKYHYVKDYSVGTPVDIATAGLARLLADHRVSTVIESTSSVIDQSNNESFVSGAISVYEVLNLKALLYQQYAFSASDGNLSFAPASVQTTSGNSSFQFDPKYVLVNTNAGYDGSYNRTEIIGRDRIVDAVAFTYSNTLPAVAVHGSHLNEIGFSDFESSSDVAFSPLGFTPSYVTPRTGLQALDFRPGYKLIRSIANSKDDSFQFSGWVKTSQTANLTVSITSDGSTNLITPLTIPVSVGSGNWQYYTATVDTRSCPNSFTAVISTDQPVILDDVGFHPKHAEISSITYQLPFGKSSETDKRGVTTFYNYDDWGRLILVKDQNQNILTKYDYQIKQ